MTTKPTPRPWKIEREELGVHFSDDEQERAYPTKIGPFTIEHDSGDPEQVEADALHIVHCVNVHDELVGALEDALTPLRNAYATNGDRRDMADRIDELLTLARARQ